MFDTRTAAAFVGLRFCGPRAVAGRLAKMLLLGGFTTRRAMVTPRTPHDRVTVHRFHQGPVMGLYPREAVTRAGTTEHFDVSYLTTLGARGADLAQALLDTLEPDYQILGALFGGIRPASLPFVVQITGDASGGSHSTCLGTDIGVGAGAGAGLPLIRALVVAQAAEVFMASFGRGWNCGESPGEGLSRVLANHLHPGAETARFTAADAWLNLDPRPNFVDRAAATDRDYAAIGCSVLFLNWLQCQLKHDWSAIVAAGGATLAQTYRGLTAKATAWRDFRGVIDAQFPAGQLYDLGTDNPFPL
jgi:hypothetical protein